MENKCSCLFTENKLGNDDVKADVTDTSWRHWTSSDLVVNTAPGVKPVRHMRHIFSKQIAINSCTEKNAT